MARQRNLDDQQQRLSEATWSVLTERGLTGLTLRAVAERAGCSTGLVLHAFPDKKALLLHARDELHARTAATADAAEASGASPRDALLAVLFNALAPESGDDDEARVWISFLAAALGDPELAARHTEQNRRFVDRIERLLAACRPDWDTSRTREEALVLVAQSEGFSTLGAADPETYSPAAQRAGMARAVRRALDDPADSPAPTTSVPATGPEIVPAGRTDDAASATLRIRPFVPTDTDWVVDLWQRCGLTRAWNDPRKDIARKLTTQPELFVVAERAPGTEGGGERLGTAMAGYDGHRGWVNYLAVDPDTRGNGIGRTLMAHLEQALRDRGCPKVNLQIREGNEPVFAFYRALGYTPDAAVSFGKRLIADEQIE
ncbi:GNAT family acetyltransferase [Herbiconiux sp.]|uniref:GNAT family acetyltransferase n=1 Tax=Herbiconiux sp. TaxID=1871186 RepID=UPI0025C255CF|nr:GNAT family acetyltransferase [Herbiconiux sp.]